MQHEGDGRTEEFTVVVRVLARQIGDAGLSNWDDQGFTLGKVVRLTILDSVLVSAES